MMRNPFRYFNSSPEVIRVAVMMYIRYPLSLRQVEDLFFERGIDICHETIRYWWNRPLCGLVSKTRVRIGRGGFRRESDRDRLAMAGANFCSGDHTGNSSTVSRVALSLSI
jgi:hypothetical protein